MDCAILEPGKFSPAWYSHKSNGPGVRWEIASSIQHGIICWINGPFPAGAWPDEVIFCHRLANKLDDNKMVHADRGYRNYKGDTPRFITPSTAPNNALYKSNKLVRA